MTWSNSGAPTRRTAATANWPCGTAASSGPILLNEREHTSPIRQLMERGTDVSAYTELLMEENPNWSRLIAA
jgi:hypothetical protein